MDKATINIIHGDPIAPAILGVMGVDIVNPDEADKTLAAMHATEQGRYAARTGRIVASGNRVVLETRLGGERFLEKLEDDPLPRIC